MKNALSRFWRLDREETMRYPVSNTVSSESVLFFTARYAIYREWSSTQFWKCLSFHSVTEPHLFTKHYVFRIK